MNNRSSYEQSDALVDAQNLEKEIKTNQHQQEYGWLMDKQQKSIKIYGISSAHRKFIEMQLGHNSNFAAIEDQINGRLFKHIKRLRLFNSTGVEIFSEDIRFVKDKEILYATAQGEDFDSTGNFSEYKIIRVLGEKGFGKVLLGKQAMTKEKVAIKILNTQVLGNAEDINDIFKEAQVLQTLNHKNVVKIHKCYTLQNMKVVLIMEYLSGGQLLQYLEERQQLKEEEARCFIKQICEGINYCHNQKVIHRDLKLENVLLTNPESKEVKIVDFGISGVSIFNSEQLNANSIMYMAPESLRGKSKQIGPAIDIWAIGIIMYTLLNGQLPFRGRTVEDIIEAILDSQVNYTPLMSPLARHLLSRILVSDPNKRIKLIDVLKHPWIMKQNLNEYQENENNQLIGIIGPKSENEQLNSNLEVHDSYIPLEITFKLKKPLLIKKGGLSPKSKQISQVKSDRQISLAHSEFASKLQEDETNEYQDKFDQFTIPSINIITEEQGQALTPSNFKKTQKGNLSAVDMFKVRYPFSKSISPKLGNSLVKRNNPNDYGYLIPGTQPKKRNFKIQTISISPKNNSFIGSVTPIGKHSHRDLGEYRQYNNLLPNLK